MTMPRGMGARLRQPETAPVPFRGRRGDAIGIRMAQARGGGCALPHSPQLQPLVEPQLLHFRQVPLRTRVKFPQEPQASPSKPLRRASAARLA
jgi:hypothetical protein